MRSARGRWVVWGLAAALLHGGPLRAQQEGPTPPRPAPRQEEGVTETAPLSPPRLLRFEEAAYPPEAWRRGVEGAVLLELRIEPDGSVSTVEVVRGLGHGLDEAAVEAARRFRFEPARRGERPIAAVIRFRYVFERRRAAPPPATLDLQVLAADTDAPLPEVHVELHPMNGPGAAHGGRTDSEGRLRLEDLAAGAYEVRLRAEGFEALSVHERLGGGERVQVRYRLTPLSPEGHVEGPGNEEAPLFEAVAEVEPPPRELLRRTVEREQLEAMPGTRGDALRTVELLPGVVRPPVGAGLVIVRGASPQDSEVRLDGLRVPLLYHFGGLTSFFPGSLLERIDFFPGNFSARYGAKRGGIVEVVVRDPTEEGLHGRADLNLLDSAALLEARLGDGTSAFLAARRSYVDFFFEQVVPEDLLDVVAAPVYWDYQAALVHRPSRRDRIRLLAFGSSDRFRFVLRQPLETDPAVRGDLDLRTEFHYLHLRWDRKLPGGGRGRSVVRFGRSTGRFALGRDLYFEGGNYSLEGRTDWSLPLSEAVSWHFGLVWRLLPFSFRFRGPGPRQFEGNASNQDPLGSMRLLQQESSRTLFRLGLYTESELRPARSVRLVLGLRLDHFGDVGREVFDPRAQLFWKVSKATRLRAGLGLYSQPPSVAFTMPGLGNPALRPLRSLHVGLGLDQNLDTWAQGLSLTADLFYKPLWNDVSETERGEPPFFTNAGIGRIYGMEIGVRYRPQDERWVGQLAYTLSRSERRDRPEAPWRLFDFDQTHVLSAVLEWRPGRGWRLGGAFRYVTGNPYTPIVGAIYDGRSDLYLPLYGDANSARNPAFHRLDLRVEKTWRLGRRARLTLYLDVQNAYNAVNPEGVLYSYDYRASTPVRGLPILPSLGIRGEL